MKLLRILGIGLFLLGGLAWLFNHQADKISRHEWDRDYGKIFRQKGSIG
jgi:hypothetical protein